MAAISSFLVLILLSITVPYPCILSSLSCFGHVGNVEHKLFLLPAFCLALKRFGHVGNVAN